MSKIIAELQWGATNATQRLLELLDSGWIVEIRRGYDAFGKFDDTYILNAKTNEYWEHLKSKSK